MTEKTTAFVIDAFEIKVKVSYEFVPANTEKKCKTVVNVWIPTNDRNMLPDQFINPMVIACGEYLNRDWGEYDGERDARRGEVEFYAHGWHSASAIARDYLAMVIRCLRGVYRRNIEVMDATPGGAVETYTVA